MAAPPPGSVVVGQGQEWPTGLCGCLTDCGSCCCGYCCHPCQYGSFAEKMGEGSCCGQCCLYYLAHMFCLQGLVAGPKRAKLRGAHGLPPEPCNDCCVHTCCGPLAVCQEMRVIKKLGTAPAAAIVITSTQPPPVQEMGAAYPAYPPPPPQA